MESILRLHQVKERRGLSRTTLYGQIAAGLMPAPVRIGARAVGWPAREVEAVNAARIAGKTDGEIRELVARLTSQRALAAREAA